MTIFFLLPPYIANIVVTLVLGVLVGMLVSKCSNSQFGSLVGSSQPSRSDKIDTCDTPFSTGNFDCKRCQEIEREKHQLEKALKDLQRDYEDVRVISQKERADQQSSSWQEDPVPFSNKTVYVTPSGTVWHLSNACAQSRTNRGNVSRKHPCSFCCLAGK